MSVHFLTQYRNPLAYPAGYAPGFDPNHVASRGVGPGNGFSAVADGRNYVNLVRGDVGTTATLPAAKIYGTVGPANLHTAINDALRFSGHSAVTNTSTTMAAIFICWGFPNANGLIVCSSVNDTGGGSSGIALNIGTAGALQYAYRWVAANSSGLTVALNVPYFAAASGDASTINFVLVNLLSGQTLTASISAGGTPQASDGTYIVGGNLSQAPNLSIAAVMHSTKRTGLPELRQWAADPWSFWYPNPGDNWTAAQVGGLSKLVRYPGRMAGYGGGLAA